VTYTGAPKAAHTARYTNAKTTTGTPLGPGAAAPRCVAPYRPIIGSALGSIIAVIMMPQLATKASPSDTVIGMNMVIIMSGSPRLDRTTSTQATAAIRSRMTEVTTVARSRTTMKCSPEADICQSAGITIAVYV